MKKIIAPSFLCALIGLTYGNGAQAEGKNSYVGIFAGTADTALNGLNSELELDYAGVQIGVWVTNNFSVEARMAAGSGAESMGSTDFEIENFGGAYGVYHWFFGDQVSVYGVAGWSDATLKLSENNNSSQNSDDGLSYGAGIKLSILTLEYLRLLDTSDVEADTLTVGLQYTFDW